MIDDQIAAEVNEIASLQSGVKRLALRVVRPKRKNRPEVRNEFVCKRSSPRRVRRLKSKAITRCEPPGGIRSAAESRRAQSRLEELSREQFALEMADPEVETIESCRRP